MKKIPLTQGKFAIVDDEDYDRMACFKWRLMGSGSNYYACRWQQHATRYDENGKRERTIILMHREILGLRKGDGKQADHRNHCTIDNRKANLRICTSAENNRNRKPRIGCASKYKGVTPQYGKWVASLKCNYKRIYIGRYFSEIDAAKAYDGKAKEVFGRFAHFNFPGESV